MAEEKVTRKLRKRLILVGGVLLALAAAGLYSWNLFVVGTFREAADRGDAGAQWTLGYIYAHGLGVWRDYAEAVRLYRQAAAQGRASAQNELGYMYYHGQGVPQDSTEALKWYRMAAEQGDGGAQLMVADMLYGHYFAKEGGVPQDYAEAAKWFRRAASQGIVRATLLLGEMHEYGRGVQLDLVQTYVWYDLAAEWRSPKQLAPIPERHRKTAAVARDRVAKQLSQEQLGLAYKLRRDWIGKFSDFQDGVAAIDRGIAYGRKGEYDRAIAEFDTAIRLNPEENGESARSAGRRFGIRESSAVKWVGRFRRDGSVSAQAEAFKNRGIAYGRKGDYDRSIADYDTVIRLKPDYALAYRNRGFAYGRKGDYDRAIADYDSAIRLEPDDAWALNEKAWALATAHTANVRDGQLAVVLAREAVRLDDAPYSRDTLAAAYAEAGRFDDAVTEEERAIEMLGAAGEHEAVADFQSRLDLYKRGRPYRE